MSGLRKRRISRTAIAAFVAFGDATAIASSGWLAQLLVQTGNFAAHSDLVVAGPIAAVLFLVTASVTKGYRTIGLEHRLRRIGTPVMLWLFAAGFVAAAGSIRNTPSPAAWLVAWLLLGGHMLVLLRLGVAARARAWRLQRRMARRVVIVGAERSARELWHELARPECADDYEIVGVFEDGPGARELFPPPAQDNGCSSFGRDLARLAPDIVMIALPRTEAVRRAELCRRLGQLPVDVWVSPDPIADIVPVGACHRVGAHLMIEASRRPLRDWKGIVKRGEDIVIASLLLLLFGPLMLIVAAVIKLSSPGPAIIYQARFGYASEPFMMRKFRTMYQHLGDDSGARATVKGDPRVTRMGRWLRKLSIDELPQLIDVVCGNMSLVGPRAHAIEMRVEGVPYHEAVECYFARHRVKPGITGLAQINGCRGLVDTLDKAKRRIAYDLQYVENWSLALDLRILCATLIKGFHDETAY